MSRLYDFEIIALLRDLRWAARVLREEKRSVVADALDDRTEMLLRRAVSTVDVDPMPIPPEAA